MAVPTSPYQERISPRLLGERSRAYKQLVLDCICFVSVARSDVVGHAGIPP